MIPRTMIETLIGKRQREMCLKRKGKNESVPSTVFLKRRRSWPKENENEKEKKKKLGYKQVKPS